MKEVTVILKNQKDAKIEGLLERKGFVVSRNNTSIFATGKLSLVSEIFGEARECAPGMFHFLNGPRPISELNDVSVSFVDRPKHYFPKSDF